MPVNRCPVRSSVSTVFTSLTVQRIHSSIGVLEAFLTSAARTSWSLKMVPSSRSAEFVQLDVKFLMAAVLSCSATRCFTSRVVCPTLRSPLCASSAIE